jgi:AraC-like DNA-binding protein
MILLNFVVLFNILLISALLLFRKNNAVPNKILAFIFLVPGINFANNINILSGFIYEFPVVYFIVQGTAILFAPLVYYYIYLLIGKKITRKNTLFFISGLLLCFNFYLGIDFILKDSVEQNHYITSVLKGPYPLEMEIYSLLFFLLQLSYFTLGAKDIYNYQKNAKDVVSDIESTKYEYLKHFILLFWLLTAITIILYISIDIIYVEYVCLPLVILVIYVFILYYAFNHNAIFTYESFYNQLEKRVNFQIQDLSETNIEKKELFPEELPNKIMEYVNNNKIFKDPEITLQKLAAELNAPAYQISKAINQGLNTTFYDLINENRIQEAKILLTEISKNNLSVEGIAYEVGFNSRTAFYRSFKKYSGKNPSDFT